MKEMSVSDVDPDKMKKVRQWYSRMLVAMGEKCCVICGEKGEMKYLFTCSDGCHDQMKQEMINDFGSHMDITDVVTGRTHRVPTGVIFEKGIKRSGLADYPVVE